ncbi:MAG: RNA polymerase sigma factor SigI [Acidimicrobiales bacterium]
MNDALLATVWQDHRAYLVDLAFRMLGSIAEAEDVVQEAFTRLFPRDLEEIDDVRGWLVVVVSRLCLDILRSAHNRRERPDAFLDAAIPAPALDPGDRVTLDDSVGLALLVVLERLTPPERTAFVLHDVFQFPFDVVASIVGRSPAACRQLASRARRRVQADTEPARFDVGSAEQQQVAERFIAACSGGDLGALMELLDADVVGEADFVPPRPIQKGRDVVARNLHRFFGAATLVSCPINGQPGVLAFDDQRLYAILSLGVRDDLIVDIHAILDPQKVAAAAARLASPGHG